MPLHPVRVDISQAVDITGVPADLLRRWIAGGYLVADRGLLDLRDVTDLATAWRTFHAPEPRHGRQRVLVTLDQASDITGVPELLIKKWIAAELVREPIALDDLEPLAARYHALERPR